MSEETTKETQKPLKDLIEAAGYTQKSFAKELGLAYSTVQYYVAKQMLPGSDILADMCRLLDKSPKVVMKALGIDVTNIPNDYD